jgi:excisionase family DNA binding protein
VVERGQRERIARPETPPEPVAHEVLGPAPALRVVTFARAARRRCESFSVERHETTQYGQVWRLLTVPELCDTLRITRTTAYRLVNSGQLRTVIVGERIRFRPEDVDAYLEREREATA